MNPGTIKILLVGCVLSCLWELSWSDDGPYRRKSDFFLMQRAIEGMPGIVSPEDIIPPIIEPEESEASPSVRKAVLEGTVPDMVARKDQPAEDDHGARWRFLDSLLDPIKDIILDLIGKGNETRKVDDSLLGGPEAYVKKLMSCSRKMVLCSLAEIFNVHCFLHCLLSEHPVGYIAVNSVGHIVKSLCDSVGTIFDRGVVLFETRFEETNTVAHFLTLFKVAPTQLKRFSRLAAKSLPTLIIKYTQHAESLRLKKTINALETASKVANQGLSEIDGIINPGCPHIESMDAMKQLVALFYTNPKSIDIIFAGYWTITRIFNLIYVPNMRFIMKAMIGGINLLTGLDCGMIYYAQVGETVECSEDEIVKWQEVAQLTSADIAKPEVCGAVPVFAPAIYDEMYSPIFFMKDARPKKKVPKKEQEKNENDTIVETNKLDFTWVDTILKSEGDDGFFW